MSHSSKTLHNSQSLVIVKLVIHKWWFEKLELNLHTADFIKMFHEQKIITFFFAYVTYA